VVISLTREATKDQAPAVDAADGSVAPA
jgi:hypothetical protein